MNPTMPLGRRLRFLLWYAWCDLFEANARRTSWVVLVTVALLTAVSVVALALPLVIERVRLHRLKADPLALSVWAGDRPLGIKITPTMLDGLREKVPARIGRPGDYLGCDGFYEVPFDWVLHDTEGRLRSTPLRGRTLAPTDPTFRGESSQFSAGTGFSAPDQGGVIVSPRLLEDLRYPADTPAGTLLQLRATRSGELVQVPIVGVVRDPLPLGHYFVMTEAEETRLQTLDPDDPIAIVWTGPLGPDWPPSPADLPDTVKEAFKKWKVTAFEDTLDGRPVWKLRGPTTTRRTLWRAYIAQIHALVTHGAAPWKSAPDFERVVAPPPVAPPPPEREGYDKVGIRVADLPALRPAIEAIRAEGLIANEGVIHQMEEINATTRFAATVLIGFLIVFGLVAGVNLYAVLGLRARQKAAEIGMLRSIGISDSLLRWLALTEALLLWLAGTLVGVLLAVALAWVAGRLLLNADEWRVVFDPLWPALVGGALLVSLTFCCWASLSSIKQFRKQSPAISLSMTS